MRERQDSQQEVYLRTKEWKGQPGARKSTSLSRVDEMAVVLDVTAHVLINVCL